VLSGCGYVDTAFLGHGGLVLLSRRWEALGSVVEVPEAADQKLQV